VISRSAFGRLQLLALSLSDVRTTWSTWKFSITPCVELCSVLTLSLSLEMPREFRKRGKKTKKSSDKDQWKPSRDEQVPQDDQDEPDHEPHAGPSWIIPASKNSEEINLEAPFGFLDVDVKAYFRTVDLQIRSWQDNGTEAREGDTDPNEGI
jgi:hypothetical protein